MLEKIKIKEIRDIRTRLELELENKNLPFQRKEEVESLRNHIDTWLEEKEYKEREHYREVIKSES